MTRRRPLVVVAAIVAAVALVAATFAAFAGRDDAGDGADAADRRPREREQPADDPSAPPTSAPDAPAGFDAVVADLQAFVEQERGLAFVGPVNVELAGDDEFEARLLEDFEEDVEDLRREGRVLEALGLVEAGTDIVEAVRTLLGAGVVGFYDPETDELVVRGASTSPYVRSIIVHELVHALDDQHFELDRPELDDRTDEASFGFTALVEGDARRIEEAYRNSLPSDEQLDAIEEELSAGGDIADLLRVPPVLLQLIVVPYLLGPELVERIVDGGGQDRLDAAFEQPPTTSEHLLDPATFLAGEPAVEVPLPATDAGAPVVDEGTLGALLLAALLDTNPLDGIGAPPLDAAVAGWGGDRYVVWDDADGSGTCMRATLVGDTPADTQEIAEALGRWAARPGAPTTATIEVGTGGAVELTSCSA